MGITTKVTVSTVSILSVLAVGPVLAEAPKANSSLQCSTEGLTQNCEFFKKNLDKPVITLQDGTGFPNPLRTMPMPPRQDPHMHGDAAPGNPMQVLENIDRQLMSTNVRTLRVWNSLTRRRVSPRFKVAFNALPPHPAFAEWAGLPPVPNEQIPGAPPRPQPPKTVRLPWPPTSRTSKLVRVRVKDVIDHLNMLPREQKNAMKALMAERQSLFSDIAGLEETLYQSGQMPGPNGAAGAAGMVPPGPQSMGRPQPIPPQFAQLFDYTKRALLDEVAKGRDPATLPPEEKIAYTKMQTVKIIPPDPSVCTNAEPNAFYMPITHAFMMCPGFEGYPPSQIVRVMAHEMAHAFDPCSQRFPLLKINGSKMRGLARDPALLPNELKQNPDVVMALDAIIKRGGEYVNAQMAMEMRDPKALNELVRLGYAEVVTPGVPDGKYPYKAAYTCLREEAKFRDITETDIEKILNKAGLKSGDEFEFQKSRLKTYSQCIEAPGATSHMSEVMCDAWSSKVLGRYLMENPPKNEVERIAPFAVEMGAACSVGKNYKEMTIPELVQRAAQKEVARHPRTVTRANEIFLTEKRTQKALGCQPVEPQDCLSKIGTAGSMAKPALDQTTTPAQDGMSTRSVQ